MTLNLNKAIIAGNITREIELRQTPSGISAASFTVAVARSKKGKDGNYIQETDFIDCQAWDKKAEATGPFLEANASARARIRQFTTISGMYRPRDAFSAGR